MSSNNDIIVSNLKDQLLVPLKAIFTKNGKKIIYVKKGGHIEELPIVLTAQNDQFASVEETIQEGDLLLLYQPEEFKAVTVKVASRQ
jgi:hypothetical protein